MSKSRKCPVCGKKILVVKTFCSEECKQKANNHKCRGTIEECTQCIFYDCVKNTTYALTKEK